MNDPQKQGDLISLIEHWGVNCQRSRLANYLAANAFSRSHVRLGIAAVALSAVVGTSVFASLGKQIDPLLQILVGALSVLAAVLAALQTFLKHGDRASAHRLIGARYGALARQTAAILAMPSPIERNVVDEVRTQMDKKKR